MEIYTAMQIKPPDGTPWYITVPVGFLTGFVLYMFQLVRL